jgi:SPP1 gp7 family putative phage head morphogenesis protein
MRDAFITKTMESATRRRLKVFRGKEMLRKKFIIAEELVSQMKKIKPTNHGKVKAIKNATDKKEKKVPAPLIKDEKLKEKYAVMVLKAIDNRAERFKTEVTKKAQIQGNALLLKLQHEGDLTKNAKGGKRKAIGKDTKKLVNDYYEAEGSVWAEFSFPFVEEFARQAGAEAMAMINPAKEFVITEKIRTALQKRAKEFGLGVNQTTRDRVTNAIDDGLKAGEGMTEISARISAVYEDFPTWRSDLIARTESTAANNEGFIEAYKQSEVATHKEWVAVMDARTRPEHAELNGEIVAVGKNFSNGLQYPQEPNCRCVLAPAFEQ